MDENQKNRGGSKIDEDEEILKKSGEFFRTKKIFQRGAENENWGSQK